MKNVMDIEGIEVTVEISKHAQERMRERGIDKYVIFSFVMKMGERILELKNGDEFAIIDKEEAIAVIYSLSAMGTEIFIDVVTVIENTKVWVSKGTKVLKIDEII